jgi:hypothetical protein
MGTFYGNAMRMGLLALACVLMHISAVASNGPRFMENKGQYPAQALFHLRVSNADVFFQKDRLVFNFRDPELLGFHDHDHDLGHQHTHGPNAINAHAYHIIFEGAAKQTHVEGTNPYQDLTHFFIGNDPSKWAHNVRAFDRVRYLGLYPGIDMEYFGMDGNLKYDLIVGPKADASVIAMRYEGADRVFLKNGELHVINRFNEVTEMRPVAYQTIEGRRVEVECMFVLNGNSVSFSFPDGYDMEAELVIDPVLIFSSYSGSDGQQLWLHGHL